jgi:hypothetical protein
MLARRILDTQTRPPLLPTSLRPTSCHPHHDDDLHFEHPVMPNTLHPYDILYVLVSHDRGPLTSPFPVFLAFGFLARDF